MDGPQNNYEINGFFCKRGSRYLMHLPTLNFWMGSQDPNTGNQVFSPGASSAASSPGKNSSDGRRCPTTMSVPTMLHPPKTKVPKNDQTYQITLLRVIPTMTFHEEEEEKTTHIKSNKPHLTDGETSCFSY